MKALITGGSCSGKSTYAEKLITSISCQNRVYIATMQVYDEESQKRVARHQAQRAGKGFLTIECPKNLSKAEIKPGSTVLLEDIPNLLANEMFDGGNPERICPAIEKLSQKCSHLIIVTNDVFSDGYTYSETTTKYMEYLAEINNHIATTADYVAETVCSIPVILKGNEPCMCSIQL